MRKRYSTRNSSKNTTTTMKPIRLPREHPPAAERTRTKTSAVRLAPATRTQLPWQNQARCAWADATQEAPRRRRQRGECPPARRSATPPGAAKAQPGAAGRPPQRSPWAPNERRPARGIPLRALRRDMRAARRAADRHRGRAVGRPCIPRARAAGAAGQAGPG